MLHRNTMRAEFFGPTRGGNKCLILYSGRNHATIGLTGVGGRRSIVVGGAAAQWGIMGKNERTKVIHLYNVFFCFVSAF